MSDTSPTVTNNAAAGQFEIRTANGTAVLSYRHVGDALDLVHTEVPASLEGHGYGSALVEAALAHARHEHLGIIPSCPFVKAYVERHPEAAALVRARR